MKAPITIILLFIFSGFLSAQIDLNTYLPSGHTYLEEVPTPKEILGYQPGEWHVSHDQMVYFLREMAKHSPRVILDEYGFSYENRPLIHAIISSPSNLENLEEIKRLRRQWADPNAESVDISNLPLVVLIGPSVHGNEASGVNSALLTVYYWAAAQGQGVEQILENTVIIVEGSFNPDGMNRFASWVNSHKSLTAPNPDLQDLEHNEAWPRARTNHYWFDLNRDWLPVQHPESQARIRKLHEWKPNVVTDHHEMGNNSTFFFQPGIESMQNPLIPKTVWDLTTKIADYHVHALDSIGELYYAKESFDEFYFGYGSTYPDVTGAVGILFEQASTRGHASKTINGHRDFSDGVRNHFNAALSTIKGSYDLKDELQSHLREFYTSSIQTAKSDPVKAYVFGATEDQSRVAELIKILNNHKITVNRLARNVNSNGIQFGAENSYIVNLNQPGYIVAKSIFETERNFADSLFYDVSSWTFPLSMGIPHAELDARNFNTGLLGEAVSTLEAEGAVVGEGTYAYVFEMTGYYAHRALYSLLKKKIRVKTASRPFSYQGTEFDYGTILIPTKDQKLNPNELLELIQMIATENGLKITAMPTGYTGRVNLGSNYFQNVEMPKVAIVGGNGVNSYEVGEIWHLLDYRMKMPLTILDNENLRNRDLSEYNTLIMVDGSYDTLMVPKLKSWIASGGTLFAQKRAAKWVSDRKLIANKFQKDEKDTVELMPYADLRAFTGARGTRGAIFKTKIDRSHPIFYGYESPELAVFRNHNLYMERTKSPFNSPMVYDENPIISGFIHPENLSKFDETVALTVGSIDRGRIIATTDNHNFRAIWHGTNKILLNAIFFGKTISSQSTR